MSGPISQLILGDPHPGVAGSTSLTDPDPDADTYPDSGSV